MKTLSLALSYASAITSSVAVSITHLWKGRYTNWESETAEWQDITG